MNMINKEKFIYILQKIFVYLGGHQKYLNNKNHIINVSRIWCIRFIQIKNAVMLH